MKRLIQRITKSLGRPKTRESHPELNEPLLLAVNASKGTVIARSVQWAGTSEARRRGLLGRDSLDPHEGVYLVPTQCIHMFGMRFPIDIAFLASDGRVIHTYHGIKPNRLSRFVWRSEGALELAEGTLRASNTNVGDIVEFHEDPGELVTGELTV